MGSCPSGKCHGGKLPYCPCRESSCALVGSCLGESSCWGVVMHVVGIHPDGVLVGNCTSGESS